MQPLVSILIPAYNSEAWIADTIRSALGQTWPNKEIIVVDDGSSDRTLSVARQFAPDQVKVVTQRNAGAAAARNASYAMSRGDFIQWLDADDLLAPDKIEKQLETLKRSTDERLLLSSAWGSFYWRSWKAAFLPSALWTDLTPVDWLTCKMRHNLHMQTSTWLVSRKLTDAAGPWDTRLSLDDDGEYFCRVLLASSGTKFIGDAKTFYRATGCSSLSVVDGSPKKLESQFLSMTLHIRYLLSLEESERTRSACLAYIKTWFPYFCPRRMDLADQLRSLAKSLGGCLEAPRLSWKYAWLEPVVGANAAKQVQQSYNNAKSALSRSFDRICFELGKRNRRQPGIAMGSVRAGRNLANESGASGPA